MLPNRTDIICNVEWKLRTYYRITRHSSRTSIPVMSSKWKLRTYYRITRHGVAAMELVMKWEGKDGALFFGVLEQRQCLGSWIIHTHINKSCAWFAHDMLESFPVIRLNVKVNDRNKAPTEI